MLGDLDKDIAGRIRFSRKGEMSGFLDDYSKMKIMDLSEVHAGGAGNAVVNAGLGGAVQVVAYDATAEAIELMGKGVVSLVLAQKPFDMGYMAVQFAVADNAGVTSLPRRVETGFSIITKDNVEDPEFSRFIYKAD